MRNHPRLVVLACVAVVAGSSPDLSLQGRFAGVRAQSTRSPQFIDAGGHARSRAPRFNLTDHIDSFDTGDLTESPAPAGRRSRRGRRRALLVGASATLDCREATGLPCARGCTDAIARCAGSIPRIAGIAVLEHNSLYRIGDIRFAKRTIVEEAWRGGARSHALDRLLLKDEQYRGTLLQLTLQRTTTWRGVALDNLDGKDRAAALAGKGEGELHFADTEALLPAFAAVLRSRLEAGKCEVPPPDAVVVNLRMGDATPSATHVISELVANQWWNRTVINVVMHFAPQAGNKANGEHRAKWFRSPESDRENLHALQLVLEQFHRASLLDRVRVRSQPDADADVCYLLGAQEVVSARLASGFAAAVHRMREATWAVDARALVVKAPSAYKLDSGTSGAVLLDTIRATLKQLGEAALAQPVTPQARTQAASQQLSASQGEQPWLCPPRPQTPGRPGRRSRTGC